MHPTAARELPADQRAWAFEPKWDGYRALGHVVGGGLALRSRNGVDMAGWFPELDGLAGALGDHAVVLDGEVVAFDGGRPSFEGLQQRMASRVGRRRGAAVTYLVFDLLWLDGRLLTGLPYAERRRLLEDLEVAGPAWQTVGSFPGTGTALLAATREQGLEGVVAKRPRAPTSRAGGPGTGSRPSTTSARRSWSAASSPTATRSGRCSSACPTRSGRAGCGSPAGSTTAWSRRPGGGSGTPWPPWWSSRARSPSPRRPCSGAAGPGPGPTTRPRCSSARSWPSR